MDETCPPGGPHRYRNPLQCQCKSGKGRVEIDRERWEALLTLAENRRHEIDRLRSAADSAMVWAIDLAPQLPQPDVWRCRGCNSRSEYPGGVRHGPVCPFGKLDAAMTFHQGDASDMKQ